MSNMRFVPEDLRELYEFHEWRNSIAVLSAAYPEEWGDILHVLRNFRLFRSDLEKGQEPDAEKFGDRSKVVLRMDDYGFQARGWKPREFATSIVVDSVQRDSPTHEVDCFKGKVALEVEWNARTEFYDRDLNNFRRLFDLEAVDVGVIVTRCDELQTIFKALGRGTSYGASTTIISKLKTRLDGGAGGGCPVLAIGIKPSLYQDDIADPTLSEGFLKITRPKKSRPRGRRKSA